MADSEEIFARILEVLSAKDAPEVARKLGLAKQSVYDWRKKNPSLESLIKISETANASLHWLVTGDGERFINSPRAKASFDEIFENKIVDAVRQEIIRGAVTIRDASLDSQEVEYEVLNRRFSETAREILFGVAQRMREAAEVDSKTRGENVIERFKHLQNTVESMERGEIPERMINELYYIETYTHHNISWLLTGEGDRKYVYELNDPHRLGNSPNDALIKNFLARLHETRKRDALIEKEQEKKQQEYNLRITIREIVREELGKAKGRPVLDLDLTGNTEERKSA